MKLKTFTLYNEDTKDYYKFEDFDTDIMISGGDLGYIKFMIYSKDEIKYFTEKLDSINIKYYASGLSVTLKNHKRIGIII